MIDGVWIHNQIYCALRQLVTRLYGSLSQTDWCSVTLFTTVLGNASYSGHSSASGLMSRQAGSHLMSQDSLIMAAGPHCMASAQTTQKTLFQAVLLLGDVTICMDCRENAVLLLRVQSLLP
jgi:hypothetical protein